MADAHPAAAAAELSGAGAGWRPHLTKAETGNTLGIRRITLELLKPTTQGETQLHILTNLPPADAPARQVAALYADRWTIETAFQRLTLDLQCEEEGVLPTQLIVRTNRYLNNGIEQDHRRVKQRVRPMLGFKRFTHAAIAVSGIELVHQIKKGQFDVSILCSPRSHTPQIWEAGLAA